MDVLSVLVGKRTNQHKKCDITITFLVLGGRGVSEGVAGWKGEGSYAHLGVFLWFEAAGGCQTHTM